nr:hypothetical protein [Tanacetum cinerariifolium]
MTKQERESMLYDKFDKFTSEPGESFHSYYMRFAKLVNDMKMIPMSMSNMQINTKFVNHLQPGVCNAYGTVIDVFIPFKKSKAGKRFAFVRFIKVVNLDRLTENLCTIWNGRLRLHANVVRFQRVLKPNDWKPKGLNHESSMGANVKDINVLTNLYITLKEEGFQNVELSYLGGSWVLIDLLSLASKEKFGLPLKAWTQNTFVKITSKWGDLVKMENNGDVSFSCKRLCVRTRLDDFISERFKVIVQGHFFWIRAKEQESRVLEFRETKSKLLSSDDESFGEEENLGSRVKEQKVYLRMRSSLDGNSRGILCVWEPSLFVKDNISASDYFLAIMDLLLGGYSFTWAHKTASKIRKLDRFLITEELNMDYGATPFRVFHSWFNMDGFDRLVEESWNNLNVSETNGLQEVNSIEALDIAQKAKVRWSIEGDENSKIFPQYAKLKKIPTCYPWDSYRRLDTHFPNELSLDQLEGLERVVTYDEIKRAVWDCGTNKSPGPDGFTFDFFRRYWSICITLLLFRGCLTTATGSVLVNDSPTSEFCFHKGEWDASNINTIVKVLKCFFMAFGLKINIQKSKLMGLGVHLDEVDSKARLIGCSTFILVSKLVVQCRNSVLGMRDSLLGRNLVRGERDDVSISQTLFLGRGELAIQSCELIETEIGERDTNEKE